VVRDVAGNDLGNELGIYPLIFGVSGHFSPPCSTSSIIRQ
jgi:hypothetical protein